MKSLADQCKTFFHFSSRTLLYTKTGFVKYYKPVYEDYEKADQNLDLELIQAVRALMSDVPIGVLLSGGWILH
jgi:asparagine synthase (glutamine-hydrolysing)